MLFLIFTLSFILYKIFDSGLIPSELTLLSDGELIRILCQKTNVTGVVEALGPQDIRDVK